MNCKKGDLAVIIKAEAHAVKHIGKIVRCVSMTDIFGRAAWNTEVKLDNVIACEDECLHPIRDQQGEDETIQWAGKPVKEEV